MKEERQVIEGLPISPAVLQIWANEGWAVSDFNPDWEDGDARITLEREIKIDTTNDFGVGVHNGNIFLLTAEVLEMGITKEKAIRLAAWLVGLADPLDETFPLVREAVQNT